MMNEEEMANVVQLIEDLLTDLRNGNLPETCKLIASLGNFLTNKQPLGWQMLATFLMDTLDEAHIRTSLLHFLVKVKDEICPSQPDQGETS
ncbi:hypothetical protein ES705_25230 [subsurface metagenome]